MKAMRLADSAPRIHLLVLEPGEDPMAELARFSRAEGIRAGWLSAIGAFRDAVVAWYDVEHGRYERIAVDEQVEVLSMQGNVAAGEDGPVVHAHVVLGRRSGAAIGGHLVAAHVRPTLELLLIEGAEELRRRRQPSTGLALLDPDA